MSAKWRCRVMAGIVVGFAAAEAVATTVIVPTDQPTVQAAVAAAGAGGTVIINSNATFTETVTVMQSLTIQAGVGFTPTIQGIGACGVAPSCALFFEPNSASPQTLLVQGLRLLPKSGVLGSGPEVVRILNLGAGDANVTLDGFTIENPEGFGFLAVDIRRICSAGLNHVTVQNGSIAINGANEAFAGEGGFQMPEGGSLSISNLHLVMSGISAQAFEVIGTPGCGGITFGLSDSAISITPPSDPYSADLAYLFSNVTATITRNTFQAISNGDGSTSGIYAGGGSGAMFSSSITLDANRFIGSGPNVGDALQVAPYTGGSVVVTATNNVVQAMRDGFQLGQPVGNLAGGVTATLANNTVDGSLSDAIALNSADGSILTVTAENNLLTHNAGWGVSLSSEAGGVLDVSADDNGFFDNASGNVQAPLAGGPHDVFGDPLYVNRASGDLRLGIGSPMIDAGNNSFVLTASDADGEPRIQHGIVDIGAFEGTCAPNAPDSDGDGICDAGDNCRSMANPGQEDTGGIGASSGPDGIGDACQCGDVTGNGRVTIADSVIILRSLLMPPTATQTKPELCDVGGSAGCSLADAVILLRANLSPATATVLPQCAPANPH